VVVVVVRRDVRREDEKKDEKKDEVFGNLLSVFR